ncbi:DUF4173 domain-containing protein [uncultured Croceicoccus sp.]|uniref:DUF4153 domain-containing protein n=1 Tax=uncultured Croceicoccus sp. TaxID=1295329 RepID=UPI002606B053|nr:DUF4173 domain-containing protein [uncultured Croceicoccus sp.]
MPISRAVPQSARFRFLAKLAMAAILLALSDAVFFGYRGGSVMGAFALVWLLCVAVSQPSARRSRAGRIGIAAAFLYALVLILDPGVLAVLLFLTAIGSVALLARHDFDHAGYWFVRLCILAALAPFRVAIDLAHAMRLLPRDGTRTRSIALHVAMPFAGGAIFLLLFASANPVIGDVFAAAMPDMELFVLHGVLLLVTLCLVWPSLRPRTVRMSERMRLSRDAAFDAPVTAMLLTLGVFNAVFMVENTLDLVFLWSGAALPDGVTLADYAHRGAYTLILTALLAGGFVLFALRPGSPAAANGGVRALLLAFVAQNILLVASSMLRLVDYIEAYSLTVLRIAALAWMVSVAIGLVLICWRLMAGRSAGWLINANALVLMGMLSLFGIVDAGAVAAAWNVRHARDGNALDLCYLESLGTSSLIPLIELRIASVSPVTQDRAAQLSERIHADLRASQSHWQGWSVTGARRLEKADRMLRDAPKSPGRKWDGRACDGAPMASDASAARGEGLTGVKKP